MIMMKWQSLIGALVLGAGLCNPSYGFEWLDQLLGIDLDNSQAATYAQPAPTYQQYSAGYAPHGRGSAVQASTAGYAPYFDPTRNGSSTFAPTSGVLPQTSYRTFYRAVPVTSCQPSAPCGLCGNQVTAMRPVVTYRMQTQVVPYPVNQPIYAPATSYAPAPGGYLSGNR